MLPEPLLDLASPKLGLAQRGEPSLQLGGAEVSRAPVAQARPPLSGKGALTIAVVFMAAAGALTVLMLRRSHKTNRGSVITRSMKKD